MILPSLMLCKAVFSFEEFGAFDAVPLPQARKIFCRFGCFVLGEVVRRVEVCVDLIEGAGHAFGFDAADGAHGSGEESRSTL